MWTQLILQERHFASKYVKCIFGSDRETDSDSDIHILIFVSSFYLKCCIYFLLCTTCATLLLFIPGGPAADPGEARAQSSGAEEAGGDQRVLAGSGKHHSGQSAPAVRGQQGWPVGSELRKPGPETGPAGGSTGLCRPGTGPHICQQAAQKTTGLYKLKTTSVIFKLFGL